MTKTNRLEARHFLLIFGAPLLILLSIAYIATLPIASSPNFAFALSLDLILTIPIVYFLLIRKTQIPKTTIVVFIILGIFLGKKWLPAEYHTTLNFAQHILVPLIEISIISYIIFRMRKIILEFRKAKNESPDFLTTLRSAVAEIFPKKIGELFVIEVAIIYYTFFAWKIPPLPNNTFTYHKKSGLHLVFGIFIGLVLIETFAFHILVERWSVIVAWIGTGISLYSIVQIIGIIKSASRRPIILENEKVLLRYGLMNETEIRYEDIEKIELSRRSISNNPLALRIGTELTGHNVIIFLKNKNTLHGLFGIKKEFNTLMIHVDKHKVFKEKMEERIFNNI